MSATAGPPSPDDRPDGDSAAPSPQPPYPGWSVQQPEPRGWGEPGGGPGQNGWRQPGAGPSGLPGGDNTRSGASGAAAGTAGYAGWAADQGRSWQIPDAKPGVIPLRPLGVGEILDGAVTTIRRNLSAMLGLSAVVATVTQLLSTGTLVWLLGDQVTQPNFGITDDVEQLEELATGIPAAMLSAFVTLIATVFLTGVLTVVVGQAVLGRHLTIREAWNESKGRLLRLLGLTLLYTLLWLGPFLGLFLVLLGLAAGGVPLHPVLIILGFPVAAIAGVWLYVRYALSLPALMLETSTGANGTRPIRVTEALRRSGVLTRRSWWRVFAILLLITFIVWLISQVVAVPFGVTGLFGGGDFGGSVVAWFALNTLAGMIAATITAPFSAAATALLYVDRRIRREGLDIELARAAGVELPGRGGATPP